MSINNPTTGGRGSVSVGQSGIGVPTTEPSIYSPAYVPQTQSGAVNKILQQLSDKFPSKIFTVVSIPLGTTFNAVEYDFTGTSFRVQYSNNARAAIQVQFNDVTNGLIDMNQGSEISGTYFNKFFVTNQTALTGALIRVLIWNDTPSVRLSVK